MGKQRKKRTAGELAAENDDLRAENESLHSEIERLEQQIALLKKALYGQKSEKNVLQP